MTKGIQSPGHGARKSLFTPSLVDVTTFYSWRSRRMDSVCRKRQSSLYADMDLSGVVGTLESHWVVLDAEVTEIRKDYDTLCHFAAKHGDAWSRSMSHLKKLRIKKENLLKESAYSRRISTPLTYPPWPNRPA